jgi:hypothetical protein
VTTYIEQLDPRNLRVVVANHKLLRRDFPQLSQNDTEVDRWLLREAGWMRRSQLSQRHARLWLNLTRVKTVASGQGIVPSGYGRAMLRSVSAGSSHGCLDVKGSGASMPRPGWHNTGLMTLNVAIREFFNAATLEAALSASNYATSHRSFPAAIVGQYAVLALEGWRMSPEGDLIDAQANDTPYTTPALLARQCYPRPNWRSNNFSPYKMEQEAERTLRCFGITMSVPASSFLRAPAFRRIRLVNYQFAEKHALIDSQTMNVLSREVASMPAVSYTKLFMCCRNDPNCRPVRFGRKPRNNDTDACAASILASSPQPMRLPLSATKYTPLASVLARLESAEDSGARSLGCDVCQPTSEASYGWAGMFHSQASTWDMVLAAQNDVAKRRADPSVHRRDLQPALHALLRCLACVWPATRHTIVRRQMTRAHLE